MRGLALTAQGDLDLDGTMIDGIDKTAQELRLRLLLNRAEYWLDVRRGLPWGRWVTRKITPAVLREIELTIADEIRNTNGVVRITEAVKVSYIAASHTIVIAASALTSDGNLPISFEVPA